MNYSVQIERGLARGDTVLLMLSEYEAANLKEAIHAIGYPAYLPDGTIRPKSPLSVLNNGDWIGQIEQKLPDPLMKPNMTEDELRFSSMIEPHICKLPPLSDGAIFYGCKCGRIYESHGNSWVEAWDHVSTL